MINKMAALMEEFGVTEFLEPVIQFVSQIRETINQKCSSQEPSLIICYTVSTVIAAVWLYNFIFQEEDLISRTKKWFFRTIKRLPYIGAIIQRELDKALNSVRDEMMEPMKHHQFIKALPTRGKSGEEVMQIADSYQSLLTCDPQQGKVSGTVYTMDDPKLTNLLCQIYGRHSYSNPLHPDIFTDVRKIEAEVVRMCLTMFNGGPETCGVVSSGGTESIMLACKAYRNMAYERGVKRPEMIVPRSAHAAFDKAAACFRIKLIHVPVDAVTWSVKASDVKAKINSNTCMLAVSAPSFPHGIIEPVEEVAKLGVRYNIPVHVDCCLGGFLLPFMEKAGFHDIPPFDFRVKGVTSISCDTHKYGYAPKGSSVILYSESKYRNYQFDVIPDWTGGIYATPTFAGSRCGANLSTCWAAMLYMGEDGYIDRTRRIIQTTRYIKQRLQEIDSIYIFGDPKVSVVALGSLDFNIFRLYDALTSRGWHLNALQFPSSFHICVTMPMTRPGVADMFVDDVQICVKEIMLDPKAKCGGMGALYGMAQSIPDRRMVNEICYAFLGACYSTDTGQTMSNGANGRAH